MADFSDLFLLGYDYSVLMNSTQNHMAHSTPDKIGIEGYLQRLQRNTQILGIDDKALAMFIGKWQRKLPGYSQGTSLSLQDSNVMRADLAGLWDHLVADFLKEKAVILEIEYPKFNPKRLRAGVKELMAQDIAWKCPQIVVEDLNDGIKCLLMGLWTPSVMICLRAVEGVLRDFFKSQTGNEPVLMNGYFLNWSKMLTELKDKWASTELMVNLEFLKDIRNEAEHPGKRFDQRVAEKALDKAIEAIEIMLQHVESPY